MAVRRSNSNPVLNASLRKWCRSDCILPNRDSLLAIKIQSRHQASRQDGPSSRDKARYQSMNDADGNPTTLRNVDDMMAAGHLFGSDPASKVSVPQLTDSERNATERQRYLQMTQKFGELGPGGKPTQAASSDRRDMIEAEQDVDGLPWEVRWKKTLIPTPEEVISEVRDRFELQYDDPIEREKMWYLHWKDRSFSLAPDRLIWPQGYTDHLDHYDEFGRRRILPTDQKWSDSSWKHLADAKYRDRLFLMDSLERKHFHESLLGRERVMEIDKNVIDEQQDMEHALAAGVVSLEDDQALEQIAGTSDALEIKSAKEKIGLYQLKAHRRLLEGDVTSEDYDPVTGLLKVDLKPLKSGLTVEEAVVALANTEKKVDNKLDQIATAALRQGRSPLIEALREEMVMSKKAGGKPIQAALTKRTIETIKVVKGEGKPEAIPSASVTRGLNLIAERLLTPVESESTTNDGFLDPNPSSNHEDEPRGHAFDTIPTDKTLEARPEWYEQTAVNSQPLIKQYNLTHDPIESQPVNLGGHGTSAFASAAGEQQNNDSSYFVKPKKPKRITSDQMSSQGVNTFDEMKYNVQVTSPELRNAFEPLPLYNEVSQSITPSTSHSINLSPLTFKGKREAHQAKKQKLLEQELMLPDMEFESDTINDPTRGISDVDIVPFDREAVIGVYNVYRGYVLQRMREVVTLSKTSTPENIERYFNDHLDTIRNGKIALSSAETDNVDPMHLEVIQLIFEAHLLRYLADYHESSGNRLTEVEAVKRKADDLNRTTIAKAKLIGPSFFNFLSETATMEMEKAKENPFSKNMARAYDMKFNYIVKPFLDWYNANLVQFLNASFDSNMQIEQHVTALRASLLTAMSKVNLPSSATPASGESAATTPKDHQAVLDAFHHWSRALIHFYSGKHYLELFKRYASSAFRSSAENEFNEANDYFQSAYDMGQSVCVTPVPDYEPFYKYDDTDFTLTGEGSPILAEKLGNLEKAENGWTAGSKHCWYPFLDETESMWYYERRGIFSNVAIVSERSLDSMNKKSHPSVHPFPEKAIKFLEGAPLTQETAEHLWLRYMGLMYWEHAQMNYRNLFYQTGRDQEKKALGFLYKAVEQAQKSLPATWKAPLVTKATYLCRSFAEGTDTKKHIRDVEDTIEQLYAIELAEREEKKAAKKAEKVGYKSQRKVSMTDHWVDRSTNLPYRIALIALNATAYGAFVNDIVNETCPPIPDSVWERALDAKVRGEDPKKTIPEIARFEKIFDEVFQEHYCNKILLWREKEVPHSRNYYHLTYLYFEVRVKSSMSETQIQKEWEMFKPSFDVIYSDTCIGNGSIGDEQLHKSIRAMIKLLSSGSGSQKQLLLKELKNLKEKMPDIVHRDEIIRSISSLEGNLKDATKPIYCYLSIPMQKAMESQQQQMSNPDIKVVSGNAQYKSMKERMSAMRELRE